MHAKRPQANYLAKLAFKQICTSAKVEICETYRVRCCCLYELLPFCAANCQESWDSYLLELHAGQMKKPYNGLRMN